MSPSIYWMVEGDTEKAFRNRLKIFLDEKAQEEGKPKIKLEPKLLKGKSFAGEIKSKVPRYLKEEDCIGVVALTDVHPCYKNAADAKRALRSWMPKDSRCHAHAALYEFEAWLLTNWDAVLKLAKVKNKKPWASNPETINHSNPPSVRLAQLFSHEAASRHVYDKVLHGKWLMMRLDLVDAAKKCSELKAFLNTLLKIAGYEQLK